MLFQAQVLQLGSNHQHLKGSHFPSGTGATVAHEHGSNKEHAVADNTEKQTSYKLGIEMAAAGIWSDLLNTSAVNRLMCWMRMQWEMLSEGALPNHSSQVKRGTKHSQHFIQPSGVDVSDISLNLPSLTRILPLYAGVALPKQGGPCMPHSS